jgi:hypothetical protein
MLRGQDILLLLQLLDAPGSWTIRSLGSSLGADPAGVHRGIRRLEEARLLAPDGQVNRSSAEEFILHGLKYQFPGRTGGLTRGMPTAWAAPPLDRELAPVNEPPPVWPDRFGNTRGMALEPLHKSAVEAGQKNPLLAERLALIDAIRIGDGRVRAVAEKLLSKSLKQSPKKQ